MDACTTVEERRFSAASSAQKSTGLHAPVEVFADTTHHAAIPKTFVIPNRAGSLARNLLSADATTNRGAPSFAHFAKEPTQTKTIKKIGGSQLLNRSINFQRDVDTSSEQTSYDKIVDED